MAINHMHLAARCGAKTKRNGGAPCKSPAMPNGRCRMHGGTSKGAPKGNKNAYKHGQRSAAAIVERKAIAALIKQSREMVD
jgi:uncharacterized protein YjcR